MGLSSSIFNFEACRQFWAQPLRRQAWHALIGSAVLTAGWFCSELQVRAFRPSDWKVGEAEVLFIGTSYVNYGVSPERYERQTGKFWFPAMAANVARAAFTKHSDLWPNLDLVLIEIDEWTLFTDSVKYVKNDYSRFAGKLQLNVWELPEREDAKIQFWSALENLCLGRGVTSLHQDMRFNTELVLRRLCGFGGIFPSATRGSGREEMLEISAKIARQRVGYLGSFRADSPKDNIQALIDLALDLKKKGVQVVLFTFPAHDIYNEARPSFWDGVIADSVARVRAALAPDEVAYWDFRYHPDFRDREVYKDMDHLSRAGGLRFASMLQERISALAANQGADGVQRGR